MFRSELQARLRKALGLPNTAAGETALEDAADAVDWLFEPDLDRPLESLAAAGDGRLRHVGPRPWLAALEEPWPPPE